MKTLADFKRALTLGSKWSCYNHLYNSDMGVREVSMVRSNSFGFRVIRESGEEVTSLCDFPKASDIEITSNGTVNIYGIWRDSRRIKLSYRQV